MNDKNEMIQCNGCDKYTHIHCQCNKHHGNNCKNNICKRNVKWYTKNKKIYICFRCQEEVKSNSNKIMSKSNNNNNCNDNNSNNVSNRSSNDNFMHHPARKRRGNFANPDAKRRKYNLRSRKQRKNINYKDNSSDGDDSSYDGDESSNSGDTDENDEILAINTLKPKELSKTVRKGTKKGAHAADKPKKKRIFTIELLSFENVVSHIRNDMIDYCDGMIVQIENNIVFSEITLAFNKTFTFTKIKQLVKDIQNDEKTLADLEQFGTNDDELPFIVRLRNKQYKNDQIDINSCLKQFSIWKKKVFDLITSKKLKRSRAVFQKQAKDMGLGEWKEIHQLYRIFNKKSSYYDGLRDIISVWKLNMADECTEAAAEGTMSDLKYIYFCRPLLAPDRAEKQVMNKRLWHIYKNIAQKSVPAALHWMIHKFWKDHDKPIAKTSDFFLKYTFSKHTDRRLGLIEYDDDLKYV